MSPAVSGSQFNRVVIQPVRNSTGRDLERETHAWYRVQFVGRARNARFEDRPRFFERRRGSHGAQALRASVLSSGEIGIRTRDAGFPTYRISNPALSATQPSLRLRWGPVSGWTGRFGEYSPKSAQIQGQPTEHTASFAADQHDVPLFWGGLRFVHVEPAVAVGVEAAKDRDRAEKFA